MKEFWHCSCGRKNDGNFCIGCGKRKEERWVCPCGNENRANFCTECGKRRGEKWTGLHISERTMMKTGEYCFNLETDDDGNMRLYGNCYDDCKYFSRDKSHSIAVADDVTAKLREMNLDGFPVKKTVPVSAAYRPSDEPSGSFVLTYPDGTSYKKAVSGNITGCIHILLANELVNNAESANPNTSLPPSDELPF